MFRITVEFDDGCSKEKKSTCKNLNVWDVSLYFNGEGSGEAGEGGGALSSLN